MQVCENYFQEKRKLIELSTECRYSDSVRDEMSRTEVDTQVVTFCHGLSCSFYPSSSSSSI